MPITNEVALIFSRSDQLLWLWNFYVGIVVVTLAAAVWLPGIRENRWLRFGLMFLFAFVAYANLESMRWVLLQWRAIAEAVPGRPLSETMEKVIEAPHPLWVFPFHLILDLAVLVAIGKLTKPKP